MKLLGLDLPNDVASLLREDFLTRVLEGIAEHAGQTANAPSTDRWSENEA
ncbi:hypothetical protein AB0N07_40440 [Streptomyces sp. NPDC051172]